MFLFMRPPIRLKPSWATSYWEFILVCVPPFLHTCLWPSALYLWQIILPGNKSKRHAPTNTPPEKQLAKLIIFLHLFVLLLFFCLLSWLWVSFSIWWLVRLVMEFWLRNKIRNGRIPKQMVVKNIANRMIYFWLSRALKSSGIVSFVCIKRCTNLAWRFILEAR